MSEPVELPITQHFTGEMQAAYEELRPVWLQVINGEMSAEVYEQIKATVFRKYGL